MSDDEIARARNRRLNATAPEPKAPRPRMSKPRKPKRLSVTVQFTHVVQEQRGRTWTDVHNGSAADCAATLDLVTRHFPDKTHRMVSQEEADSEHRRKTWSVNDADNIPIGSRVMLVEDVERIHASITGARKSFGLAKIDQRIGIVKWRDRQSGCYGVTLEGCGVSIGGLERDQFYFPVPDVVPMRSKR